MAGVPNLVLCIPTSAIKAEEMDPFPTMRHTIKWHIGKATLAFHKHLAFLMFLLVELGS
jgi:hypothetical protein